MTAHTQQRLEPKVMAITINGKQGMFFVAAVPETAYAVAITGSVSGAKEAQDNSFAEAERIAACWNAFVGIPTEEFEGKSLEEYVTNQAYLNNLTPTHSGVDIGLSGIAAQMLASSFAGQFTGTGATNFLEINMEHPAIGDFSVTIQKTSGLTPAAMKAQAEKERDEALAINTDLLAALQEIDNWLVCSAIATPEDMAQGFQHMQGVASAAIAKAKGGA